MKYLLAIVMALVLAACTSKELVQQATEVVYKTKYLTGAPIIHPDRPDSVDIGEIKPTIEVITPGTVYVKYEEMVKESELDEEVKAHLIKSLKAVTVMAEEKELFTVIGTTKEDYFNLAKINLKVIKWMRQANANFEYYESLNLRLVPEEESYGENLNKLTEVNDE